MWCEIYTADNTQFLENSESMMVMFVVSVQAFGESEMCCLQYSVMCECNVPNSHNSKPDNKYSNSKNIISNTKDRVDAEMESRDVV